MKNALINISINASQAMENGGVIQISTNNLYIDQAYCDTSIFDLKAGEYLEIALTDTGLGIETESIKKIFDPFFTTKKQGKGTGLGLSEAYGIIQNHHGEIRVSSELGVGTCFSILLPCVNEEIQEESAL